MGDTVLLEVSTFFFLYMICMACGTLLVAASDGVPVPTAVGAMLTSVSNMGPAPFHEGADTFAGYSAIAKMVFSGAMILGRLEFFTILALLTPDLWRR
jgi:trk system potassium uptake protein TrkH